jgi:hypothetical protein
VLKKATPSKDAVDVPADNPVGLKRVLAAPKPKPKARKGKRSGKDPRRMAVAVRKLSGFRVYCDESNTDSHKPYPVYGAILVAPDDIRKVQQELADWRRREEMHGELKWEKVHGGLRLKKIQVPCRSSFFAR